MQFMSTIAEFLLNLLLAHYPCVICTPILYSYLGVVKVIQLNSTI